MVGKIKKKALYTKKCWHTVAICWEPFALLLGFLGKKRKEKSQVGWLIKGITHRINYYQQKY